MKHRLTIWAMTLLLSATVNTAAAIEKSAESAFNEGVTVGQAQLNLPDFDLGGFVSNPDMPTYSEDVAQTRYYRRDSDIALENESHRLVAQANSDTQPANAHDRESKDVISTIAASSRNQTKEDIYPLIRRAKDNRAAILENVANEIHGAYANCVPQQRCETTYNTQQCNETYMHPTRQCHRQLVVEVESRRYAQACNHLVYQYVYTWGGQEAIPPNNIVHDYGYITFGRSWSRVYIWLVSGADSAGYCLVDFIKTNFHVDGGETASSHALIPANFPFKIKMYLTPYYELQFERVNQFDNQMYTLSLSSGQHFPGATGESEFLLESDSSADRTIAYSISKQPGYGFLHKAGIIQILVPQSAAPTVQDHWEDACQSLEAEHCVFTGEERCVVGEETRIINGLSITRSCWRQERDYQCQGSIMVNESTCEPLHTQGCERTASECIEQDGSFCLNQLQTYRCPSQTCVTTGVTCLDNALCLDGNCGDESYQTSQDFDQAMAALSAIADAAKQFDGNQSMIFSGHAKQCRDTFIGFKNCCNDSGWGVDLHLSQCNQEEKELGLAKERRTTVYLGKYCAHRVLGICTEHKRVSCVFGSKLARLVQEQGRRGQLGIGFGSAEAPDCRALTPEQLQRIDFAKINFREIYDELRQHVRQPNFSLSGQATTPRVEAFSANFDPSHPQCLSGRC